MNEYRIHDDWNRLKDFTFFVGFATFVMFQSAFYFRMIEQTSNRLIDTGVMKHLVEEIAKGKLGIKCPKDSPKILTIQDLAFGFNIWIGFCAISLLSFILETLFSRLYIQWKQIYLKKINVYPKIHPEKHKKNHRVIKLNPQTRKHFRVKKAKVINSEAINIQKVP